MFAYFVLLVLLLVWAVFNAPWHEGRALREDDEAMHSWFCAGKNYDAGPCVEWRLLEAAPVAGADALSIDAPGSSHECNGLDGSVQTVMYIWRLAIMRARQKPSDASPSSQ